MLYLLKLSYQLHCCHLNQHNNNNNNTNNNYSYLAKLRLQKYVKISDEKLVSSAGDADETANWGEAVESKHEVK